MNERDLLKFAQNLDHTSLKFQQNKIRFQFNIYPMNYFTDQNGSMYFEFQGVIQVLDPQIHENQAFLVDNLNHLVLFFVKF